VAASSVTADAVTGANPGAGPVTVKVVDESVVGLIREPDGTVKVALIAAFGHTVLALAAGFVDSTDTFPAALGAAAVKVHT
jgi:hypothetical protein